MFTFVFRALTYEFGGERQNSVYNNSNSPASFTPKDKTPNSTFFSVCMVFTVLLK